MYQFSSRLKTFSFILMVVGILGIGYGFYTTPKTDEDIENILKEQEAHHGASHHESHAAAEASHAEGHTTAHEATTHEVNDTLHHEMAQVADSSEVSHDSTAVAVVPVTAHHDSDVVVTKAKEIHADHEAEHKEHVAHVKHQLQNKPWSALYVACIFFMLIAVGALAFMLFNGLLKQVGLQLYLE